MHREVLVRTQEEDLVVDFEVGVASVAVADVAAAVVIGGVAVVVALDALHNLNSVLVVVGFLLA